VKTVKRKTEEEKQFIRNTERKNKNPPGIRQHIVSPIRANDETVNKEKKAKLND
jgi:hypothetical protein